MADVPVAVARTGRLLGRVPVSWRTPVFGLSAAARYVVTFEDGSSVFAKAAVDEETDRWLRTEHAALAAIGGALGPEVIAADPAPAASLLVTTDLSDGYWPAHDHVVEWRDGDVAAVLGALDVLASTPPPPGLTALTDWPRPRWRSVVDGPALRDAGLCSEAWLTKAAPAIVDADERARFEPTTFVHGDVRSDNIVIGGDGRARFVDWSNAGLGNAGHDLAQLLPTLHLEGAAPPWEASSAVAADLVVRLSGAVAARVAEPPPSDPPWLGAVLRRLLAVDLAWIAVLLGLDPPDGREKAPAHGERGPSGSPQRAGTS